MKKAFIFLLSAGLRAKLEKEQARLGLNSLAATVTYIIHSYFNDADAIVKGAKYEK